jgi:hypothetical protein
MRKKQKMAFPPLSLITPFIHPALGGITGKFSINPNCIRKIPLNPLSEA